MRKMFFVFALFLAGGLKAATNTPTPTSTIAPVTGGINDSSIEYLPNVGIGLRRVIITDSRGTPIGTATPGQIVVTNTPTITQTPTPVTNTLTPTSTFTPAQVIPVTVTGTVTPPQIYGLVTVIVPTSTAVPAAGGDINPKSTPAAAWPVSGVVTVIVPTSTQTPTGGAKSQVISINASGTPVGNPSDANGVPARSVSLGQENLTALNTYTVANNAITTFTAPTCSLGSSIWIMSPSANLFYTYGNLTFTPGLGQMIAGYTNLALANQAPVCLPWPVATGGKIYLLGQTGTSIVSIGSGCFVAQ